MRLAQSDKVCDAMRAVGDRKSWDDWCLVGSNGYFRWIDRIDIG